MLKKFFCSGLLAFSSLQTVHSVAIPEPAADTSPNVNLGLLQLRSNGPNFQSISGIASVVTNLVSKLESQPWMAQHITAILATIPKIKWCTSKNMLIRKEWRTFTTSEKMAFHAAVKKLMNRSPFGINFFSGVKSRFDDMVACHINATNGILPIDAPTGGIHMVGVLLPWHRLFLWTYELMLRFEAGYTGHLPYWDWTKDAVSDDSFANSPMWDINTGFGSNGAPANVTPTDSNQVVPGGTGGGCITSNVYKDYKMNIGPGSLTAYNPRCLTRNFNPMIANAFLGKENQYDVLMSIPTFHDFRLAMDPINGFAHFSCHGAGHVAVGGEMNDLFSSPSDPVFYMHHAMLDKIWADWQEKYPGEAGKIEGPTVPFVGEDNCPPTTLDTMMWMGISTVSMPIRYVMDTQNRKGDSVLCYKYE